MNIAKCGKGNVCIMLVDKLQDRMRNKRRDLHATTSVQNLQQEKKDNAQHNLWEPHNSRNMRNFCPQCKDGSGSDVPEMIQCA